MPAFEIESADTSDKYAWRVFSPKGFEYRRIFNYPPQPILDSPQVTLFNTWPTGPRFRLPIPPAVMALKVDADRPRQWELLIRSLCSDAATRETCLDRAYNFVRLAVGHSDEETPRLETFEKLRGSARAQAELLGYLAYAMGFLVRLHYAPPPPRLERSNLPHTVVEVRLLRGWEMLDPYYGWRLSGWDSVGAARELKGVQMTPDVGDEPGVRFGEWFGAPAERRSYLYPAITGVRPGERLFVVRARATPAEAAIKGANCVERIEEQKKKMERYLALEARTEIRRLVEKVSAQREITWRLIAALWIAVMLSALVSMRRTDSPPWVRWIALLAVAMALLSALLAKKPLELNYDPAERTGYAAWQELRRMHGRSFPLETDEGLHVVEREIRFEIGRAPKGLVSYGEYVRGGAEGKSSGEPAWEASADYKVDVPAWVDR